MSIQSLPLVLGPRTRIPPLLAEALDPGEADQLSRLFKALADPVRLQLLSLIGRRYGGEACVCDLTDAFELTQPTISHHLKVLREAGLITSDRRGTWVYYRVVPVAMDRLAALFAPNNNNAPTR